MQHSYPDSSDDDDGIDTHRVLHGSDIDLHCRIDRRYGIPRDIGIQWFDAARYGDLKTLKRILHEAEARQTKDAVLRLLHYNGQSTSYGFVGSIVLHWAVANGDEAMAKLLLEKGSSPNCQNNGGSTPLHSACANGQPQMVRLLLKCGSSPTIIDCCQETPLEVVPRERRREIVPLLTAAKTAERLAQSDPSTWSGHDMKDLLASVLGPKEAHSLIERSELVAACQDVLREYGARHEKCSAADRFAKTLHSKVMKDHMRRAAEGTLDEDDVAGAEEAKKHGNDAFAKGELQKAIRFYTAAVHLNPTEATYYSNRCACYLKLNMAHPAVKDAGMAVQLKPQWAKAHHRLGSSLLAVGRTAEALESFEESKRSLQLAGDSPPAAFTEIDENIRSCLSVLAAEKTAHKQQHQPSHYHHSLLGSGGKAAVGSSTDYDEEESAAGGKQPPVFVPVAQRKPWFECVLCENRTRDETVTPCCSKKLCGTCSGRAMKQSPPLCPFCHQAMLS